MRRSSSKGDDLAAASLKRSTKEVLLVIGMLTLLCNFGSLAVPLFNMQVFSSVLPTRDLDTLAALAVGAIICVLIFGALEILRSVAQELLAARIVTRLSLPLLQTAASAPRSDLVAADGLHDLEMLRNFMAGRACLAPFDIAMAPILIIALLAMHWALGLLGIVCIAVLALMNWLGDAISRSALLGANESSAEALRGAADAVNAAEPVLAMGMLDLLTRRWKAAQAHSAGLVHGALLRARAVSAATNALRSSMTGAMVALGLILALNSYTDSSSMVFGNMVLARLLLPFGSLAQTRRQWVDAFAAWKRLRRTLEHTIPRRNAAGLPCPSPRLVVENVSYVPPGGDRALLRGVSFVVEPGEAIAVIGPSSAGKSTLLRLLVGMAPPTSGGIYLDGNSTYLWEREDFARRVGYLPQRPTMLDESVAENISRMQTPDGKALVQAAKRAGLHRIVADLPNGYATIIAGGILSGGQRQRLAFARALYGNPGLLVLDEPSAFLDEFGEAELIATLADLHKQGVTVILATHRPALLKAMDKVLVLNSGVVDRFGLWPTFVTASNGDRSESCALPVRETRDMTARKSVRRTLAIGLWLGLVLTLFVDLAVLVVPIYDMQLYDRVIMSRNWDTLTMLSVACLIGLFFYGVLDFLRSACFAALASLVARRLHGPALETGIRRAAAGDKRIGPQLARDVNELQSFLSSGAVAVPLDALCAPLFVALLFILHPAFGWMAVAGIAGLIFAGTATELLVHPVLKSAQERRRLADYRLARSLADVELTDGQGMLPAIARRWRGRYGSALLELCRAGTTAQLAGGFARMLRLALQGTVMAVGAILIVHGDTTPGSLMGANLLLNKCLGPFDHLVESCRSWLLARDAWRRIAVLLPAEEVGSKHDRMPEEQGAGLVVRDAALRLASGKALLRDLYLCLTPGTLALVVGPNGSGKTTLLRMLAGVVEPTDGVVLLDGKPITGGPEIGYLPQSVGLMDTSIAHNIGRLAPELDKVLAVTRRVGVHDRIGRLARGYETQLGGDGAALSGGMRQRVGLARALYGSPRLIILDEPDASLDSEGADALIAALRSCCTDGAIVVVSSHRPSLRAAADIIMEMRDGRLTEAKVPEKRALTAQLETA